MDTVQINYTTINHIAREKLGLSWIEYGLADLLYNLSANNHGDYPGWCYASKPTLAKMIGVSEREIYRILLLLEKKNLIERHDKTKHLRTTKDWYDKVIIRKTDKMAVPMTKWQGTHDKMSVHTHDKMSYNKDNNNKDNNNFNTNVLKEKSPLQENKYGNPDINEAIELLKGFIGSLPREQLNRYAVKRLITTRGKERLLKAIQFAFTNRDDRYCPSISNFLDLEEKWVDLETYARRAIAGTRGGVNNKHYDAASELRTGGLDNPIKQDGVSLITG